MISVDDERNFLALSGAIEVHIGSLQLHVVHKSDDWFIHVTKLLEILRLLLKYECL
jgi:hypothetical protein